jgi:hypothetical protein
MNIAWAWAGLAEVTPWLLRFTIAGTLVTALAHVLGSTVLRQLAIARVSVWRTSVVALLLVPLLSVALPGRWSLPGGILVLRPGGVEPVRSLAPAPPLGLDAGTTPDRTVAPGPASVPQLSPVFPTSPVEVPPSVAAGVGPAGPDGPSLPSLLPGPIEPFGAAAFLWIAVASWFLLQLVAGIIALNLHARRAVNVTREVAHLLPAHARRYDRPVQVLRGGPFRVPVCWGVLRPRILLPFASTRWTTQRLQAVLIHEASHVDRKDGLFLILARVACAIHWMNPLAWGLLRRLSVDAEAACDSAVLRAGVPPRYYARVLVDVASEARSSRRPEAAMALALLRTGTLTWRVTRILDPRAMAPVARWITHSAAAVLLLGTLVGATVTLEPASAREQAAEVVGTEEPALLQPAPGVVHQLNIVALEQVDPEEANALTGESRALAEQNARGVQPEAFQPIEMPETLPAPDVPPVLQTVSELNATAERMSPLTLNLAALSAPPAAPRPRTSLEMPRRAPRITGILVDEVTQQPVEAAQINLVNKRGETVTSVITDRNGWFSVAAPYAGDEFFLHAERLGYQQTTLPVTVLGDANVTWPLRPTALALAGLEVQLESALSASGSYERRERGLGKFFGPTAIVDAQSLRASDLLATVPRVSILPDADGNRVVMSGSAGRCEPRVILDGLLVSVNGGEIDEILSMSTLDALEVYTSALQVPAQWSGPPMDRASCGAIVAWTKK